MNKSYLRWYLLAIVVLLVAIVMYVDLLINQRQHTALEQTADEVSAIVERRLSGDVDYIKLLADMRVRGEVSVENFEERSRGYLESHPELINFTWVDRDFYIRGVSPLQGNQQILGLHLDLEEPARVSALAKRTKRPQYTQAFEALQGGCSFEVWYPVYHAQGFKGLFAAVYSCEALLESVLVESVRNEYIVSFSDAEHSFLAQVSREGARPTAANIERPLNIGNNLQVNVIRVKSEFGDVNLYILTLAVVLLVGLTIFSALRLRQDIQRRNELLRHLEKSNQSLQESQGRFAALFENAPVGMVLLDDKGVIVDVNQFICRLFKFAKGELLGQSIHIFDRGEKAAHRAELSRGARYPQPKYLENITVYSREDQAFVVQLALISITRDGKDYNLVCAVDDTERVNLIEQLQGQNDKLNQSNSKLVQSNQQLERFAYVCSHDLQEPVRMVQSFGPLLEETLGERLDEKSANYLSYMVEGANRARDMIDDMLEYCRNDQPVTHYEQVELAGVCQHVKDTLQQQMVAGGGRFIWDVNLPTLPAVPSQLFQLMLNLVSNGLKFNHSDEPLVQVSATADTDDWYIYVSDNGIGIAEQYRERIFRIFERLHGNSEFPGTGIGLASCQKIVERHNAEISINSVLEQGSTFCIRWPRRQQ